MSLVNYCSSRDMMFMESASPVAALSPGVNAGVQVGQPVFGERMTWALGLFTDGVGKGVHFGEATTGFGRVVGRLTGLPVFSREPDHPESQRLLHLGLSGSGVYAGQDCVRYRSRPESHLAPYVVDTGEIDASGAFTFGAEAAWVRGPLCAQGELLHSWVNENLDSTVARSLLANRRFDSILELGCGTGKNTAFFVEIGARIPALDFWEGMIQKAKEKVRAQKIRFEVAELTKSWPCEYDAYNLISCNLVLEHIEVLSHVFSESARMWKAGGIFLINELHPFRQYKGTKARFERGSETVEVEAFVRHISDFIHAADFNGLALVKLNEYWHEEETGKPPRLVSFIFEKYSQREPLPRTLLLFVRRRASTDGPRGKPGVHLHGGGRAAWAPDRVAVCAVFNNAWLWKQAP